MTKNQNFHIRKATPHDKEALFAMIQQLATYEGKTADEVQLTINKIESHGFGENAYFNTLIAEEDNHAIGYAIYFFNYSTYAGAPILYLEDVYVEEHYRNLGIGKKFLSVLAKIAMQKKCCRMEWHVYTWNEKAIQFYQQLGAAPKTDILQFRLLNDELKPLAEIKA